MTDKEVLRLLSKKDLISTILEVNDFRLMRKFRNIITEKYAKELDKILDEQEKCDFSTLRGRYEYSQLEEKYKEVESMFNRLCGLE